MGCFEDYMDFQEEVEEAVKVLAEKAKKSRANSSSKIPPGCPVRKRGLRPGDIDP